MARTLPLLGQESVAALETAWKQKQSDWARQRLLVLRLIGRPGQNAQEIMAGRANGKSTGAQNDLLLAGKSWRSLENAAQDSPAKRSGKS